MRRSTNSLNEKWLKKIDAVATVLEEIQELRRKATLEDAPLPDGVLDCPLCGKQFRYQINPYNDHIRGACETPDCISFMQ